MKTAVGMLFAPLLAGCLVANALPTHTGHLIVSLTDRETGEPITNATVGVQVQLKQSIGGHAEPKSSFETTRAKANSNGVANVEFRFRFSDFDWWVRSPTHYCHRYRLGARNEWLNCDVEESDYMNIDTNTVQGLAMYNELVQLENDGDFLGFADKFKPKSIAYPNTTVIRSASFFPKRNPQPMYSYSDLDGPWLSTKNPSVSETNGVEVSRYKPVDFDLQKCLPVSYKPNHDDFWDGRAGRVADFRIERFKVTTNGVDTTFGWLEFAPGCGAYKRNTTGDESFPTTYEADTNAVFLSRVPFECSCVSGKLVHVEKIVGNDEYMVMRTRVMTNEVGVVTNCNYSKILGPMTVTGEWESDERVSFKALIFNPAPNDPNLESDLRVNLAEKSHGSWYP